jgi:opacity protein-like surface antigen
MLLRRNEHRRHVYVKSRLAVLVAVLVSCASAARAQRWEAGVMAGLSHTDVIGSREFNWAGSMATSAAVLRYSLSQRFALQAEAAHLRRSGVSNIASSTLTLTADYVELPVMLQLRFPSLSVVTPYLAGGPGFSLRLRCHLEFLGGGLRTKEDCDAARAQSHRFDVGAVGGAGLNVRIGTATLAVEGRTTYGLRNNVLPIDVRDHHSYSWSVLAGVSVPLNPRRSMPPVMPTLGALPAPLEIMGGAPVPVEPSAAAAPAVRRVTINARDADVRPLIMGIAETAGLNVVVSSDVSARVSVTLTDIPADEAIRAITDVAGLSILPPAAPSATTVVFYKDPLNIDQATAAAIADRFNISGELAKWVVENRSTRPRRQ